MRAEIYELITLHEKMQALEDCVRIIDEWQGLGNVKRAIKTDANKLETRIKEIMSDESKEL